MKTSFLLLFTILSVSIYGQQIAGEADYIRNFDITAIVKSAPCQGYARSTISIDFFEDGNIDFQLEAYRNLTERCKYYYDLDVDYDISEYQVCSHDGYSHPELYMRGDSLLCKGRLFWRSDSSDYIAGQSWFPTSSGHSNFEDEFLYFETITNDTLSGWLNISGDINGTSIKLLGIGLNQDIPISISTDSVYIERTTSDDNDPEDEKSDILKMKIFPNPFFNSLKVEFPLLYKPSHIDFEIFDIAGKKIYSNRYSSNTQAEINTSTFPCGAYTVRAKNSELEFVGKFIK